MNEIITNEQRPYFGLKPIQQEWEIKKAEQICYFYDKDQKIESIDNYFYYFDGKYLVKVIEESVSGYIEDDYHIEVDEERKYILPQTPKGKPKKLTPNNINKCKTEGFSFYCSFSNDYLSVKNHNNDKTLIKINKEGIISVDKLIKWIREYTASCTDDHLDKVKRYITEKKARIKYNPGDVFAYKMSDGRYLFGRVLLIVKRQCCSKKKLESGIIDKYNPLCWYHSGTILVEIYKEVSNVKKFLSGEVLIPGIFVTKYCLDNGTWEIIDNTPVIPEEVDFPEDILCSERKLNFSKGEIKISIPRPEIADKIGIEHLTAAEACGAIDRIALFYLNNQKDSPGGELYNSDLRFNKYRKKIYKLIGEDINQSYDQMAKKHGFDLSRFY